MKELLSQIHRLQSRARFDLDSVKTQLKTLEVEMEGGDFWKIADHAKKVSKEAAELRQELAVWEGFLKEIEDLGELVGIAQSESDESMHDDVAVRLKLLEEKFASLEFATLFADTHDKSNAIVKPPIFSGVNFISVISRDSL